MTYPILNTTATAVSHPELHNEHVNVKAHFGAVGDGVADDTAEIQAALDAVGSGGGIVFFPPGTYKVSSTLILPDLATAGGLEGKVKLQLLGYNATITTTAAIQIMRTAQNSSTGRYIVEGMSFIGNGTAGQRGLQICGSYGSVIRECGFSALDIGIDLVMGLMTKVESTFYQDIGTYDILVRSATAGPDAPIFGGSNDFTASNDVYLIQNRHYCRTGCDAAVKVIGSSGIILDGEIFEGGLPDVCFDFDDNLSGNARSSELRNCWFEYGSATTLAKYRTQHEHHRWVGVKLTGAVHADSIICDFSNSYNNQGVTFENCRLQGRFRGAGANNTAIRLVNSGRFDALAQASYWYNDTVSAAVSGVDQNALFGQNTRLQLLDQEAYWTTQTIAQGTFHPKLGGIRGITLDGLPPPSGSYTRLNIKRTGAGDYWHMAINTDENNNTLSGISNKLSYFQRTAAGGTIDDAYGNVDGSTLVDTSRNRIYFRIGGVWRYASLPTTEHLSGTGSPENVVTASVGAIYTRTDGGTNTTLYVKESGTGNTGWVAK